jgi:glycine/D-amino acid oxidase-like deaminating enzyme
MSGQTYDAVVIGGGFFGCSVATYVRRRMNRVLLVEREQELFSQASYSNQARIHNGYHYPRSLQTGYRSRVNFPVFIKDFPDCVVKDFTQLYCIAQPLGKVTPRQFEKFCNIIGAPWKPAAAEYTRLFNRRLVSSVYEVCEYAFNSNLLRDTLRHHLERDEVEIRLGTGVLAVDCRPESSVLQLSSGDEVHTDYLFNCTYAGLRHIPGLEDHCRTPLKQEITEMALIEPPAELAHVGVTVMCGPYFSMMPFPPRSLHTLSHVRYTPHSSWIDNGANPDGMAAPDPYQVLAANRGRSQAQHMLRDAARYLPVLRSAKIRDSLFAVKTLLVRNELDDGRPILVERSPTRPKVYSIMGGKLDNIYDVFIKLHADGI